MLSIDPRGGRQARVLRANFINKELK